MEAVNTMRREIVAAPQHIVAALPQQADIRRGPGRPRVASPKRPRNVTVRDEVWDRLDALRLPGETRSGAIERLILAAAAVDPPR